MKEKQMVSGCFLVVDCGGSNYETRLQMVRWYKWLRMILAYDLTREWPPGLLSSERDRLINALF
jgi:hypothetical protein